MLFAYIWFLVGVTAGIAIGLPFGRRLNAKDREFWLKQGYDFAKKDSRQ